MRVRLPLGLAAGAIGTESARPELVEDGFGNDRACRVAGAQKQHVEDDVRHGSGRAAEVQAAWSGAGGSRRRTTSTPAPCASALGAEPAGRPGPQSPRRPGSNSRSDNRAAHSWSRTAPRRSSSGRRAEPSPGRPSAADRSGTRACWAPARAGCHLPGRQAVGTGLHQQPEHVEPVVLRQRGQRRQGVGVFHVSIITEINPRVNIASITIEMFRSALPLERREVARLEPWRRMLRAVSTSLINKNPFTPP